MFLSNALKLSTKKVGFILTDVANLKAWYKLKTGVSVDGDDNVSIWNDSSGNTSENMQLRPPASDNDVPYTVSTGAMTFSTANKSTLATTGDQLNLGEFTIFGVVDVIESGASNEAVIGRAGNDEFRLFRAADAGEARLRADGVNYDISLTNDLPTGKFLFTLTRAGNGLVKLRINSTQEGSIGTDITDLFDFTRIGNGSTDSIIYEIAIFDRLLNDTNLGLVEANIKTRNGL